MLTVHAISPDALLVERRRVWVQWLAAGNYESYRHKSRLVTILRHLQSNRCSICGKPFSSRHGPTADHVLARAAGGFNGPGNLLLAHAHCNRVKGDRLPTACELILLVAICDRLGIPVRLKAEHGWLPPPLTNKSTSAVDNAP